MFIRKKKIKLNNRLYNIGVYTYSNNRIQVKYENGNESHDITLNLEDVYLEDDKVLLDPFLRNHGILKDLKKARIIREICGSINYNYIDIPIAKLNMGILRKYDSDGISNHLDKVYNYGQ